ncbi:MAG: type II toxin-antitoxin system VapC family toxin [Propionibacteriaceae bacterium]|nr:type II toxin-antitoxin system VapC family toxin [Propionibacteriaceae bacterium]
MIGLDTNVLIRIAIEDDLAQSMRAQKRLAALTVADPGFVSLIVLVELWWVLTRTYGKTSMYVSDFVEHLTQIATLVVQEQEQVLIALATVRTNNADFADALIVASSQSHGCIAVETFDQNAIKKAGMTPLG